MDGDEAQRRNINIEETFITYDEARSYVQGVLLSEESGITKGSFTEYDEAGKNESDCGYGENVVIHAAGINGENYIISILKSEELESVRLAEAAVRIS